MIQCQNTLLSSWREFVLNVLYILKVCNCVQGFPAKANITESLCWNYIHKYIFIFSVIFFFFLISCKMLSQGEVDGSVDIHWRSLSTCFCTQLNTRDPYILISVYCEWWLVIKKVVYIYQELFSILLECEFYTSHVTCTAVE